MNRDTIEVKLPSGLGIVVEPENLGAESARVRERESCNRPILPFDLSHLAFRRSLTGMQGLLEAEASS